MNRYVTYHVYAVVLLLQFSVAISSCAMDIARVNPLGFTRIDEIDITLPFFAGAIMGAATSLVVPGMGSFTDATPHALNIALLAGYTVLTGCFVIPLSMREERESMRIDYLIRALQERPPEMVRDQAVAHLWNEMWLSGALIANDDIRYTSLCTTYNRLLKQSIRRRAMGRGCALGYICATSGVAAWRIHNGNGLDAFD